VAYRQHPTAQNGYTQMQQSPQDRAVLQMSGTLPQKFAKCDCEVVFVAGKRGCNISPNISSLFNVLCAMTIALIFENFYLQSTWFSKNIFKKSALTISGFRVLGLGFWV